MIWYLVTNAIGQLWSESLNEGLEFRREMKEGWLLFITTNKALGSGQVCHDIQYL